MKSKYEEYDLKVGLEIHFQLNTNRKLFCNCPVGMNKEVFGVEFIRRLRPTQSELGQVDPAAYFEFEKGLEIKYYAPDNLTCLVEMDEEPPHEPCMDAIKTALRIADFFNMYIVDEIHFMRKVVIDGSNTTGFQRTAVIGLDGEFILDGKRYGVESICVEEEAARLIERKGNQAIYYLDRLGIPLVEISTSPDITTPDETVKVAEYIGRVVQATGMRRHGIGSIRQDINVSVLDGAVVEVKGVQKLELLKDVVEYEFNRQLDLIEIANELIERGVTEKDILNEKYIDITDLFTDTGSKILKGVIKKGGHIYGLRLPGFRGLLGFKLANKNSFAREFVDRIRFWTGIKGLFHIDELPAYGITQEEVDRVKKKLGVDKLDGFIIIGAEESQAMIAFEKIIERAIEALKGVPAETRGAREDGTTYYLRPRPGMARMYPETDIPPIPVTSDILKWLKDNRLNDPYSIINDLVDRYDLPLDKAKELFDKGLIDTYEEFVQKYGSKISRGYIASLLTEIPKAMEREGIDISKLNVDVFNSILDKIYRGEMEKEIVPDVIKIFLKEPISLDEAIKKLGVEKVSLEEVKTFLNELLSKRPDILQLPLELRKKRLIGIIMSKYRGKVNPKDIVRMIDEVLNNE